MKEIHERWLCTCWVGAHFFFRMGGTTFSELNVAVERSQFKDKCTRIESNYYKLFEAHGSSSTSKLTQLLHAYDTLKAKINGKV